ncbi:hypothetical protein [Nocardioides sp. CFH 31398]|uniref:hypothetical protein n=1 Tax=Nocardioides sp. CFH 31398 TaxID=2919579 RepID=UPI001F05A741|nr:hypothetical protein [Nocardioides sp. CFH 31398]MCH1869003.1 hypothetical protein [Nocardioides sp. CFH 31398]
MSTPPAATSSPLGPDRAAADVPLATRARTPGWRDPRLWIGVLIVAVSVVVGVRLVSSADDSVAVWGLATDLGVGDTVTADDLVAREVRFVDEADLALYLPADDELPADLQLSRAVGAGELLPRAALGGSGTSDVVEVPLPVAPTGIPSSVGSGSLVDVYVGRGSRGSDLVLESVVVVEAPSGASAELGAGEPQRVVVGVPEDQRDGIAEALGGLAEGTVYLTRVP